MKKGEATAKDKSASAGALPDDLVIVIGRTFGSGGRTIGRLVAEKLDIDYYDSELFRHAAERVGMHPEIFREHDEKRPSALRTLLQGAFGIADNFHSVPLDGEMIYEEQANVIRDLCRKGPCVIVGRTADYILRKHPHLVSVFLHSSLPHRCAKILQRGETSTAEEAEEMARKRDRKREAYYNYYTGNNNWGRASNYHLCIDTSGIDEDQVAQAIIDYSARKFNSKSLSPPSNPGE